MNVHSLPESMPKIPGEEIVERLAKGEDVLVKNKTITGGLDFTRIPVSSNANHAIHESLRATGIHEEFLTDARFIPGELRLERCRIEGEITVHTRSSKDYRPTIFCSHVTISGSEIQDSVRFNSSVFCDGLCLDESHFQSACLFNRARFYSNRFSVLIRQATFNSLMDLSMVEMKSDADFGRSNFETLTLQQSKLFGRTQFYNTVFKKRLDFYRTTVSGIIQFHHCSWIGGANFDEAQFDDHASFWGCQCHGDEDSLINYSHAIFCGPAGFDELDLVGRAFFDLVQFKDDVSFRRCRIAYEISFRNTLFEESLSLRESKIEGFCNFDGTRILRALDARNASIGKLVFNNDEKRTRIAGHVDLRWAKIDRLFFIETSFDRRVDLSGAQIGWLKSPETEPEPSTKAESTKSGNGLMFLSNVDFEGELNLSGSQINGDLVMIRTKCREEFDLSDAVISGTVTISDIDFHKISFRWVQLAGKLRSFDDVAASLEGRLLLSRKEEIKQQPSFAEVVHEQHEPLKRIYEKIEKWFDSTGRFVEAKRVYWESQRREFHAMLRDATLLARAKLVLGSVYPWAYLTIGVTSNFGTSMRRLLLWTLLLLLAFPVMYAGFDLKAFTHTPNDGQIKLRLSETPVIRQSASPVDSAPMAGTPSRFVDSLSFSINNFIKIGYGDVRIDPQQASPWAIGLCWFQWLLGYFWYFLFVYTFSNTAPGIKKLFMGG